MNILEQEMLKGAAKELQAARKAGKVCNLYMNAHHSAHTEG
jgi:hypothetical protein